MEYQYTRLSPLLCLNQRISGGPNLVQVITGPRQVGKTTAIKQFIEKAGLPSIYSTADSISPPDADWLSEQWERGRELSRKNGRAILVIDEIQKVTRWSDAVKKLHDEDISSDQELRVIVLGSSSLLIQKGLSESLAGRFELVPFGHWSFKECYDAFGLTLEQYIFFGGYPGALNILKSPGSGEDRWRDYVRNSLIEPVIGRDILMLTPVDKPALLRQVFAMACDHPAEIVAYVKLVGQLQDAGSTVTIASYLHILSAAGLIAPIQKYSGSMIRQRASSPKLIVLNNALVNTMKEQTQVTAFKDKSGWGRLVENAAGAHLVNSLALKGARVLYWREGENEVDFIVMKGRELAAVEIKSGRPRNTRGLSVFIKKHPAARKLVAGGDISLEDFFLLDPDKLLFGDN
jgi:hypothetical protein